MVSSSRLSCLKRYDHVIQTVIVQTKSDIARQKLDAMFVK
jgi:hypothetical protein